MAVTQPSLAHAQHDSLLIAKLAADDTTVPERVRANALVAECPECADLLRDLQALQVATRALASPVLRRDFRLTEADAARLRGAGRLAWLGSGWRAWLQWLAGPRFAFSQQLGTGLAALGIAGLLFATVPGLLGAGNVTTVLSTAGAPIGPSHVSAEAPTDQGTGKSGADVAQPTAAGTNPSAESIAGSQSAAPSAGVAAPQAGASLSVLAGPSAAPPAATVAPAAAPTAAPAAAPTAASTAAPAAAAMAAPTAAPTRAPIAATTAAPEATVSRVPQGVTFGRSSPVTPAGGGLSPFVLASIGLFLLGLGFLLARRVAVALTDR